MNDLSLCPGTIDLKNQTSNGTCHFLRITARMAQSELAGSL